MQNGLRAAQKKLGGLRMKALKMKDGGIVKGPGTSTSDEVPVDASNGEAILPKKTVDALGGPKAVEELIEKTTGKSPKTGPEEGEGYVVGMVPPWEMAAAEEVALGGGQASSVVSATPKAPGLTTPQPGGLRAALARNTPSFMTGPTAQAVGRVAGPVGLGLGVAQGVTSAANMARPDEWWRGKHTAEATDTSLAGTPQHGAEVDSAIKARDQLYPGRAAAPKSLLDGPVMDPARQKQIEGADAAAPKAESYEDKLARFRASQEGTPQPAVDPLAKSPTQAVPTQAAPRQFKARTLSDQYLDTERELIYGNSAGGDGNAAIASLAVGSMIGNKGRATAKSAAQQESEDGQNSRLGLSAAMDKMKLDNLSFNNDRSYDLDKKKLEVSKETNKAAAQLAARKDAEDAARHNRKEENDIVEQTFPVNEKDGTGVAERAAARAYLSNWGSERDQDPNASLQEKLMRYRTQQAILKQSERTIVPFTGADPTTNREINTLRNRPATLADTIKTGHAPWGTVLADDQNKFIVRPSASMPPEVQEDLRRRTLNNAAR